MARWLVLVVLILTACTGEVATTVTSAVPTTIGAKSTALPPGSSTTEAAAVPPCLQGDAPFMASAEPSTVGRVDGDAAAIEAVHWEIHPECERVTFTLATADLAPATRTPPVEVVLRRDLGVVRLRFAAGLVATAVADAFVEGGLLQRLFVVRAADGSLYADLHLAGPAEVRAAAPSSPARVVVDLRPGGPPLGSTPSVAGSAVVVTPPSGDVSYPFEVSGYARTPEANVVVRLREAGEDVVVQATTAADWLETWGGFSLVLDEGPDGNVDLLVGEGDDGDALVPITARAVPPEEQ